MGELSNHPAPRAVELQLTPFSEIRPADSLAPRNPLVCLSPGLLLYGEPRYACEYHPGRTVMEGDGSLAQESKRQDWLKRTAFYLKKKKVRKKKVSAMLMPPGFQLLKITQTLTDGAIEPSFFSFV